VKAKPLKHVIIEKDDGTKEQRYVPCGPQEATHVKLSCPGPYPYRLIPVTIGKKRIGAWAWNGDVDKPTLMPSILTYASEGQPRCHSFVKAGRIRFLADCSHELAGQEVDLLDVDDE